MKRKRFSIEQIVAVLKQAELGLPVADLIRLVGISEQTFYRWKKKYSGLQPDQARELKQLQDENGVPSSCAGHCHMSPLFERPSFLSAAKTRWSGVAEEPLATVGVAAES